MRAMRAWPPGARALRAVVVLLVRLPSSTRAQDGTCRLRSLYLRYGDRPITLWPSFEPQTTGYWATLDFEMDSFSVDAAASDGCFADKVPNQAIPVPRGKENLPITIFARAPKSTAELPYTIRVSRLTGTETYLWDMHVVGAKFKEGSFKKEILNYTAFLQLGCDLIRVGYRLLDNNQKVRCTATAQARLPADGPGAGADGAGWHGSYAAAGRSDLAGECAGDLASRMHAGDRQWPERFQAFPVDPGFSRDVTLRIQSADPMVRQEDRYNVKVVRPGCRRERPLYDPVSRRCVINCPAGFYRFMNGDVSRCLRCNTDCLICSGLSQCTLCRQDTAQYTYLIQADGSCLPVKSTFLGKYYWWCVTMGFFLALLGCLGAVLLVQTLVEACNSRGRSKYGYDVDSDGDFDKDLWAGRR